MLPKSLLETGHVFLIAYLLQDAQRQAGEHEVDDAWDERGIETFLHIASRPKRDAPTL